MKLTVFIMLAGFLQVSATGFAQKVTLKRQNAPLEQVLNEIKSQTGYQLFYSDDMLQKSSPVSINLKNADLDNALKQVFQNQQLQYSLINKTIVVKDKEKTVIEKLTGFFNKINTDGKVIDAVTKEPVPGATVILKATKRTVVADEKGFFKFASLPPDGILEISAVGYERAEIKVAESVTVQLKPAITQLTEIEVVNTGYQQIEKGKQTGSASKVSNDELQKVPSINLLDKMVGLIPGLRVDTRNNSISIRGVNTIARGINDPAKNPLIVIDGFPANTNELVTVNPNYVYNSVINITPPTTSGSAILNNFNPDDIESITILKDAAASSIWGSRAANGVIVITTKRGKRNAQPTLSFSSTVSTSAPANLSSIDRMSNRDYIDLEQELFDLGYISDPSLAWRNPAISEAQQWMFKAKKGTATLSQRDSALNVLAERSNLGQLREYLLQRAVTQKYNLSFSGGSNNTTYYISGNYQKDRPVLKSNYGENYFVTANTNTDFFNNRITLKTGINYNYRKSQTNTAAINGLSLGRLGFSPYDMLVDENGNPIRRSLLFTQEVANGFVKQGYKSWDYNPIDELNYNNIVQTANIVRFNAVLTGRITNWLNLELSGITQKQVGDQTYLKNENSFEMRELLNQATSLSGTNLVYGIPLGGILATSNNNSEDYSLRGQLNIDKTFGQLHHINVIAGAEIRQTSARAYSQTRYGYDEETSNSAIPDFKNGYTTMYGYKQFLNYADGPVGLDRKRYAYYYTNAAYSLMNKYFLSGSLRFDDYTMVGVDRRDRARPFWSLGLRWDAKAENFLKDLTWLNQLGIRFSAGTGGTVPRDGRTYTVIVNGAFKDQYTGLPYATISAPADPNLGWETTRSYNSGIDVSLLNNRLAVTFDIYKKKSYDILATFPSNGTYGWSTLTLNTANLKSNGYEAAITGKIIKSSDWDWTSNLNISYNTSKVTDSRYTSNMIMPGFATPVTGYALDNMFVYRWAGLNDKGQSQIYNQAGDVLSPTGTYSITGNDLVSGGRTTPAWFGGLTNTVSYKNISLFARISFNLGYKFLKQDIVSSNYPTSGYSSGLLSTSKTLANRWRKPGDELKTNVPGVVNATFNNVQWYNNSDVNLRDADHIRFQQIGLKYQLPTSFVSKIKYIKFMRIDFDVNNLGLIWTRNKEGIDPDYVMTNTFNNLPPTRNYALTVNLSL